MLIFEYLRMSADRAGEQLTFLQSFTRTRFGLFCMLGRLPTAVHPVAKTITQAESEQVSVKWATSGPKKQAVLRLQDWGEENSNDKVQTVWRWYVQQPLISIHGSKNVRPTLRIAANSSTQFLACTETLYRVKQPKTTSETEHHTYNEQSEVAAI